MTVMIWSRSGAGKTSSGAKETMAALLMRMSGVKEGLVVSRVVSVEEMVVLSVSFSGEFVK